MDADEPDETETEKEQARNGDKDGKQRLGRHLEERVRRATAERSSGLASPGVNTGEQNQIKINKTKTFANIQTFNGNFLVHRERD